MMIAKKHQNESKVLAFSTSLNCHQKWIFVEPKTFKAILILIQKEITTSDLKWICFSGWLHCAPLFGLMNIQSNSCLYNMN